MQCLCFGKLGETVRRSPCFDHFGWRGSSSSGGRHLRQHRLQFNGSVCDRESGVELVIVKINVTYGVLDGNSDMEWFCRTMCRAFEQF